MQIKWSNKIFFSEEIISGPKHECFSWKKLQILIFCNSLVQEFLLESRIPSKVYVGGGSQELGPRYNYQDRRLTQFISKILNVELRCEVFLLQNLKKTKSICKICTASYK
jgi:hypothetical protein